MNNKKIVSFSSEISQLKDNRLFDPKISKLYPGASWQYQVKDVLINFGYACVTADVALKKIISNEIHAKNILVIQHGNDKVSQKLIKLGAIPFLITMLESPLYAENFYKKIKFDEVRFAYSMLFRSLKNQNIKRYSIRFPSFFQNENCPNKLISWNDRKFASMVIANKYVPLQTIEDIKNIDDFFWWISVKLRKLIKPSSIPRPINLKEFQLQDRRLETIIFFLKNSSLDLYGKGWDSLWRIPPTYRKPLSNLLKGKKINAPHDKINTIKDYKFNLCYENIRYPGYVTEKIIDAIFAGTIPIYLGAQDITDFVPGNIFIDASKFDSLEQLYNYMNSLDIHTAEKMLAQGKEFLSSDLGKEFSYEGNAQQVVRLIFESSNNNFR
jgi:hypothetical protein